MSTIAALILAAGGGRRYGGPVALVRVDGEQLLDRALSVARHAGCEPVLVVLGAEPDAVRSGIDLSGTRVVVNAAWRSGSGSSVKAGLAALGETDARAAVVLPVDLPGVTADAVTRIAKDADETSLRSASYDGQRGNPVVLGRSRWPGVAVLASADVGTRAYLLAHAGDVVDVPCGDVADGTAYVPPEQPRPA